VHGRLESILAGHGARAGESLRRLCASADWQTRRAAAVLVERLGVSSALPAVGALLGDPQAEVRSAAVRALAASASEKGAEILAHHLSRADAAVQAALLEELTGLDRANVQAVLRKLVELLDQRTADKGVYLWVISAIARTPTGESVTALALVVRARHWTAPLRGRLFGIAAVSGLGAIGSPAAIEALLDAARTRAWGVASHARRELARLATRQTSASR
jgi:HEAT repeat protein